MTEISNEIQTEEARAALDLFSSLPKHPQSGDYLNMAEAQEIVDETLRFVEEKGDPIELVYLKGHRKRLIETLQVVPKALSPEAKFLDVGCYGYFGLWACRNLGYATAVGTEMPREDETLKATRKVVLGQQSVDMEVYHFDLTDDTWPFDEEFDTVICLEVLEHVDHDPSGVLDRLRDRLKMGGTLVLSGPNGVSYKTLGEMFSGMPPWTYWFYNPDLSHEPRHSLEYTPFTNALMLRAAGFSHDSFKTIDAYNERADVSDIYEIAGEMGFDVVNFGDTMISTATKVKQEAIIRFPDAIYSGKNYYESTWPLVEETRRVAMQRFADQKANTRQLLEAYEMRHQEQLEVLEAKQNILVHMRKLLDIYEVSRGIAVGHQDTIDSRRQRDVYEVSRGIAVGHQDTIDSRRQRDVYEVSRGIAVGQQDTIDRRRLMLYRLLSPGGVAKIAEAGVMPERGQWKRVFKRHPFKLDVWRALRRLHYRMKDSRK